MNKVISTLLAGTTLAGSAHGAGIATQVVAGYAPTCVLTTRGEAFCWGYNVQGAIGDGTSGNTRNSEARVMGLADATQLAAGFGHACALRANGSVVCWGANTYGQLGDGSNTDRNAPVAVSGLAGGVRAIAAGAFHTCALRDDGAVRCWGYNADGELGDGTTQNRATPVALDTTALPGVAFATLAGGGSHTCAIDGDGQAWCWGANAQGQLGNGTNVAAHAPVAVSGLTDASAIAAGGSHSCAVTTAGAATCWGSNLYGELGLGVAPPPYSVNVPSDVPSLASGVSAIALGLYYHSCALTTDGAVTCWGKNNDHGQLGDGTHIDRVAPVAVLGIAAGATSIALGSDFSCAVVADGGVRCWGRGAYGNLGDGNGSDASTPVAALGFGDPVFRDGFEGAP